MKKMIRKLFCRKTLAIVRLFLLGMVMLLFFSSIGYAQTISTRSVSVLPSDSIKIKFDYTGDEINSIEVRYIPDLDDLLNHIDIPANPPFSDGEIRIANPSEPGYLGALNFLLRGVIDGVSVSDRDFHSTIFLENIESISVSCELGIYASWMNYAIYPTSLQAFPAVLPFDSLQILMYDQIGTTCNIETERVIYQTEQSYWDDEENIQLPADITPGTQPYCFRFRSYDSENPDLYAHSNMIRGIQISELESPQVVSIVSVDVIDNDYIEIKLLVDSFGYNQFEYRLYRSDERETDFDPILQPLGHTSQEITFRDLNPPDLQSNPWYYYVKAYIQECPDVYKYSNTASSIFLQAEIADSFDPEFSDFVEISLSWEHDPAWDEYVLRRRLPGSVWEDVSYFDHNNTSFSDEAEVEAAEEGISYILEARKDDVAYAIHSNQAEARLRLEYVNPISVNQNAIRPDSPNQENRLFSPEAFNNELENYSMIIYDRNGLLVFSTNDHEEAWDGTINGPNGTAAPDGTYIYHIKMTDDEGVHHEKKGIVYLVR